MVVARTRVIYFWIVGRIDDVLNVAGHRIGTAEVESALVSNPKVAEAAVVGRPDDLLKAARPSSPSSPSRPASRADAEIREELRNHVGKEIGPVAKPDDIRFAEALPKTRSGKIMRRVSSKTSPLANRSKATSPPWKTSTCIAKLSARPRSECWAKREDDGGWKMAKAER